MSRDLTNTPGEPNTAPLSPPARLRPAGGVRAFAHVLVAALAGLILVALAYQISARHEVDIGGYDAAYTRGFFDPQRAEAPGAAAELAGSDGSARWTRAESFLLFPQIGLPAELTLHMRGPEAGPVDVVVLAGSMPLGRARVGTEWQTLRFTLDSSSGIAKPEDVLISVRAPTGRRAPGDPRQVGVLLDRATLATSSVPVMPYPSQLLYGALAGAFLALALRGRPQVRWGALLIMAVAFLVLYRLQPAYPYPLRGLLPAVCAGLLLALGWQHVPRVAATWPGLADSGAALVSVVWLVGLALAARQHLVLSVPGVEKDFRVFATRARLPEILHADGFYNLGYPLFVRLARPLALDNPFLAGQVVAWLSAAVLLGATWWLARAWLGRYGALAAVALLAFSPLVVQYGLYVGSDMPFAALCALTLALLLSSRPRMATAILAGITAGAAFLVRHPGLVLVPLGWAAIVAMWRTKNREQRTKDGERRTEKQEPGTTNARLWTLVGVFSLAWALAIAPQIVVNVRDTGQPFYSQQAKNIWLAVFGDGDWGRWGETSNDIALSDVVLQDPNRFAANLWANLRGFAGAGAEDTSEFGHALQLRLLAFPANWLALGGLLAWLVLLLRQAVRHQPLGPALVRSAVLVLWIVAYVLAISVGFALPRFFLPLVSAYAIAGAWCMLMLLRWLAHGRDAASAARLAFGSAALILALVWNGVAIGTNYVVRAAEAGDPLPGQPADALAAARLVLATLAPGDRLVVAVPAGDDAGLALGKYSAIAHHVIATPTDMSVETIRDAGARFVLWSQALGAAPAFGAEIGRAGPYVLYQVVGK